ncbi:MAG TPA: carboxypeptidase-like regulatory domain-containing protein, partial [Blastocatellia bacterium]
MNKSRRGGATTIRALFPVVLIIGFAAAAFGQTTATIRGTVRDNTGAGIAKATVTAINQSTGAERAVET